MHKTIGVKLDAAAFRIYYLTKDNKIKRIIYYSNGGVIDEVLASYGPDYLEYEMNEGREVLS